MVAAITWLDASSEDQRRMREIIRLFEQRESRDELGLSQFRDALSDGLFPGTSVLLTRARYLLFVPWAFIRGGSRTNAFVQSQQFEYATIPALKGADDTDGLLGKQAGKTLKTLPSAIYWNALSRFGILTQPGLTREQAAAETQNAVRSRSTSGYLHSSPWHPELPPVPDEFPKVIADGFELSSTEASWLRERMVQAEPQSLLAHLLFERPRADSNYLWNDPAVRAAPRQQLDLVELAETFSLVVHGAQLLYNLLLAEQYREYGFDDESHYKDLYITLLDEWATEIRRVSALDRWNLPALTTAVSEIRMAPVNHLTARFVDVWAAVVTDEGPEHIAESNIARTLVADRERRMKRKQARLKNPKRIEHWNHASGADRLSFRWTQIRQIILDVHDGLDRDSILDA